MQSLKWISLGAAIALVVVACSRESESSVASAQTSSVASSGGSGGAGGGGAGGDPFTAGTGGVSNVTNAVVTGPGANASTGSFGSGGAGGDGCGAEAQNVLALLVAAQNCALGGPLNQCTDIVGGVCCPVVVADKDSSQSNAYEAALLQYQGSGCKFNCPPTPCNFMPKGTCAEDGANSNVYQCSAQ